MHHSYAGDHPLYSLAKDEDWLESEAKKHERARKRLYWGKVLLLIDSLMLVVLALILQSDRLKELEDLLLIALGGLIALLFALLAATYRYSHMKTYHVPSAK